MKKKVTLTLTMTNYSLLRTVAELSGDVSVNTWAARALVPHAYDVLAEYAKKNAHAAAVLKKLKDDVPTERDDATPAVTSWATPPLPTVPYVHYQPAPPQIDEAELLRFLPLEPRAFAVYDGTPESIAHFDEAAPGFVAWFIARQ